MKYNAEKALKLLRLGSLLPAAEFHKDQEEAIRHIVEGKGRLLVVQKTGWGKSFVYFIATKLLREGGSGPTLLISPLLALMRNQIAAAKRMGVRAETINSDNMEDWDSVEEKLKKDEIDILLISPERFTNEHFKEKVLPQIAPKIALLVVDEAHCISDWGHDFRPLYRQIARIPRTLPQNLRLLATTATANKRVMDDLSNVLGPNLTVMRGDLNRPSLFLQTILLEKQSERLAWLAAQVPELPGHGIVYTLTVRDAVQVADWLRSRGINVEAYTGETGDRREELEQALLNNKVKALVATTALGMGFDKPDLGFVIHYQSPGSVVAYYQQVGRAGRAISTAYGIILSGKEETDIINYFINTAFPSRKEAKLVIDTLLAVPDGLTINGLMEKINLTKGRIEKTLLLLSLESPPPIVKHKGRWQLTTSTLAESFWQRAERLTDLRKKEQEQMRKYVKLSSGHMEFIIKALDGEPGELKPPDLPKLPASVAPAIERAAIEFLRRTSLPLELRKKWPAGGMPIYKLNGFILKIHRAMTGKVLCVWGDAGWGETVKRGKYKDGNFSDELVDACVKLVQEWNPNPKPCWITCIPSLRHPELLPGFAKRLAKALGIPFYPVLRKTGDRPEQKTMENSVQQARNVDGAFELWAKPLPKGPVLLLDDMVDSRWTLTVASWLLRQGGSKEVFPFALSKTGRGE